MENVGSAIIATSFMAVGMAGAMVLVGFGGAHGWAWTLPASLGIGVASMVGSFAVFFLAKHIIDKANQPKELNHRKISTDTHAINGGKEPHGNITIISSQL